MLRWLMSAASCFLGCLCLCLSRRPPTRDGPGVRGNTIMVIPGMQDYFLYRLPGHDHRFTCVMYLYSAFHWLSFSIFSFCPFLILAHFPFSTSQIFVYSLHSSLVQHHLLPLSLVVSGLGDMQLPSLSFASSKASWPLSALR